MKATVLLAICVLLVGVGIHYFGTNAESTQALVQETRSDDGNGFFVCGHAAQFAELRHQCNQLGSELNEAESLSRGFKRKLEESDKRNRELAAKVAALEAEKHASAESQSATKECGLRDPVTGLAIEKLAQAKAVFAHLEAEARADAECKFKEEATKLSSEDLASGKIIEPRRQTAEEWRAQRVRAYDALCLVWGREATDAYISNMRTFWVSKVGDGKNDALVAQTAMEYPGVAEGMRVLGARDE